MGKIYSKQMESINLQTFESVIFSQDANPSLISHNSTTFWKNNILFHVDVSFKLCQVSGLCLCTNHYVTNHTYKINKLNY